MFLKDKPCRVFPAPCDVFFPRLQDQREDDVDTVVQPDLLVVCEPEKIHENGIWGAPDLTIEILSPSTSRKDLNEKFRLYEREGVREYWVINPVGRWLQQYVRGDDGLYGPQNLLVRTGIVTSGVFPDWSLDIASLWPEH